ncbi:hypothetical protein [Streptococcus agalactiae]|uniref:hypothetical protein n=1 Tax=Streptococcus agalactiae TaxID=1311 RepID=UPI000310FD37
MWNVIIVSSVTLAVLGSVLFVLGWLRCSHRMRYINGYDIELERDYKEFVEQMRKRGA